MEVRQLNFQSEFKTREEETEKVIEGYFVVFNQETRLTKNIYEMVSPEAVTRSLAENDIRALFSHKDDKVLGRLKNKTLQLTADDYGIRGRITINENDREAMDIYERVKRGDIDSCSFGFYVNENGEERIARDDGSHLFVLRDINIQEVSVVTFPAYPQTQISARKLEVEEIEKEKLEARKKELKERLSNVFNVD